jgi:DNA-binding response OmpR family regulator
VAKSNKKVLIVEDDTNLREFYRIRLSLDFNVVTASNGEEGLAMAVSEKPDLIILDAMMPKVSGFDALDIMRSTETTKTTPIIMMTALSQDSDRQRAAGLGVSKYLVKSEITLDDFVNEVHRVIDSIS